jgi:nicotinamide phosphoribosyltransferase
MRVYPAHATDFYKTGHIRQYPAGTTFVYSNLTCRSDRLAKLLPDFDHKVVSFGIQGVCKWLLRDTWNREFFQRPKAEVVERYTRRMDSSLGKGAVDVSHIAALHDLGYLPVLVKALPEGSRVNIRVPLFTIQNTIPEFYWLSNYLETQLSAELWKPSTTATVAYEYRRLLERYARETGAPPEFVDWQGHDFSPRGMSGIHDSAQSGAGHLLSFLGTDSIHSIDYLEDYYGAAGTFVGGSVPATEHSVMCMGGMDDEFETFRRLIEDVYPSGIVSIVSDTWDFWGVVGHGGFAQRLKDKILARRPDAMGMAKTVFRPDSGDPVRIICGYHYADVPSLDAGAIASARKAGHDAVRHQGRYFAIEGDAPVPLTENEAKGSLECLHDIFGGTVTPKGYKVLNDRVGLIYGDSITLERAQAILAGMKAKGFASSNMVFGIGSFTYQYCTRDTFGSAVKATYGVVGGVGRPLFKDPKTDGGTKKSAKGLLRVEKEGDDFVLYEMQTSGQEQTGALRPVFRDGKIENEETLATIRRRLRGEAV